MTRTVLDKIEVEELIWDVIPADELDQDAELLVAFDGYRFYSTDAGPVAVWMGLPSDAMLGICG